MHLFNLPHTTLVNKVVPKNAFDHYTTAKQKKLFADLVSKITWLHKLSPDTVNLEGKEIKEIQIFQLELKIKEEVQILLDIIDKAIPYYIIFIIKYEDQVYLSTSTKHPHPVNEDNAVIDWTFRTDWFSPTENRFTLQLKKSLDAVYHDFCTQLSEGSNIPSKSLNDLVQYKKQTALLEKEISKLKKSIANCKQFNQRVEFNLRLNSLEDQLHALLHK